MTEALNPKGPLLDLLIQKAEQKALAHIFVCVIGLYKNPHSHRSITIKVEEATETIVLVNNFLNLVNRRINWNK